MATESSASKTRDSSTGGGAPRNAAEVKVKKMATSSKYQSTPNLAAQIETDTGEIEGVRKPSGLARSVSARDQERVTAGPAGPVGDLVPISETTERPSANLSSASDPFSPGRILMPPPNSTTVLASFQKSFIDKAEKYRRTTMPNIPAPLGPSVLALQKPSGPAVEREVSPAVRQATRPLSALAVTTSVRHIPDVSPRSIVSAERRTSESVDGLEEDETTNSSAVNQRKWAVPRDKPTNRTSWAVPADDTSTNSKQSSRVSWAPSPGYKSPVNRVTFALDEAREILEDDEVSDTARGGQGRRVLPANPKVEGTTDSALQTRLSQQEMLQKQLERLQEENNRRSQSLLHRGRKTSSAPQERVASGDESSSVLSGVSGGGDVGGVNVGGGIVGGGVRGGISGIGGSSGRIVGDGPSVTVGGEVDVVGDIPQWMSKAQQVQQNWGNRTSMRSGATSSPLNRRRTWGEKPPSIDGDKPSSIDGDKPSSSEGDRPPGSEGQPPGSVECREGEPDDAVSSIAEHRTSSGINGLRGSGVARLTSCNDDDDDVDDVCDVGDDIGTDNNVGDNDDAGEQWKRAILQSPRTGAVYRQVSGECVKAAEDLTQAVSRATQLYNRLNSEDTDRADVCVDGSTTEDPSVEDVGLNLLRESLLEARSRLSESLNVTDSIHSAASVDVQQTVVELMDQYSQQLSNQVYQLFKDKLHQHQLVLTGRGRSAAATSTAASQLNQPQLVLTGGDRSSTTTTNATARSKETKDKVLKGSAMLN